jgi:hypothetical protein
VDCRQIKTVIKRTSLERTNLERIVEGIEDINYINGVPVLKT